MTRSSRYIVLETVHQDGRTEVIRALRTVDRRPVLLKALDPHRCGAHALERLRHEYELGSRLDVLSVARPLALETFRGMPTLVVEDHGGAPLDRLLERPMAVEPFLEIAARIAGAVSTLHSAGVIHKDLKPENILVHPDTREVWLADLGLATRLARHQQAESEPPQLIEGSLPYLSPEQTGRMNRPLDTRSDLYNLGVLFFRMITGRLPFEASDPPEWIHCHIARSPPHPCQLAPDLPGPIADIILRLLAKMPDERYQSARGVQHDLEHCLQQWRSLGRIEPFALATRDVSERLQLPAKLFGRDEEQAALQHAFERVASTGIPELVLVSGAPGVGKSSLVRAVTHDVRERSLVLTGKFDKDKRDIPYSTVVQAFRELVHKVLTRGEEEIAAWRQRLRDAVGANAQLMIELIPQLELLMDKQPPVSPLPLHEAKLRFHRVFRQFLSVFSTRERPLVGFVDDLQWADSASLELLADVMTHFETRHVLVIAACRDTDVAPGHPMFTMLSRLRQSGIAVHERVLRSLSREHLNRLVAETLRQPRDQTLPLTELLIEKTAGNPFFAVQFLLSLHDDGLICFDPEALVWRWDLGRARARGYTDNVVDLMLAKLRRLPTQQLGTLMNAACFGHSFDVAPLSALRGQPEQQTRRDLEDLLREGLLFRSGDRYRFAHDRIRQAAYTLFPEDRRGATHLRLGRLLLAQTPAEHLGEQVFDIVNQLNRSANLIADRDGRLRLAELDLIAARRSMASAAYGQAAEYLAAGMALLPGDAWQTCHELASTLHVERARCEHLVGRLEEAERCLDLVLRHAPTRSEKSAAYRVRIEVATTRGAIAKAIEALLECVALFGFAIEPHPTDETVRELYASVMRSLGARPIEDLAQLPSMSDPDIRALLDAIVDGFPTADFFDGNLVFALLCESVRLSIEHGLAPSSPYALAAFGTHLGPLLGRYRDGYRFGKLGHDLVEQRGLREYRARTRLTLFHCQLWTHHIRHALPLLEEAVRGALETGHLNYACYCAWHTITVQIARGDPLGEIDSASARQLALVRSARYGDLEDVVLVQRRFIRRLRGLPDQPNESEGLDQRIEGRFPLAAYCYYVRQLQERFLFGDHGGGLQAASMAERMLWSAQVLWERCEHSFFLGLSAAACCAEAPLAEREGLLRALRTEVERNRVWAENCPESFRNRHALLSAELAHLEGRDLDAERLFEQAIRCAGEEGFIQNEALAWEQASKFYRSRDLERIAETYLSEARACYLRWGADGKVRQLDRLLLRPKVRLPDSTLSFALRAEQLDLLSVVKASQTISSELQLERLGTTLLHVVLEQGGAQRGILLLARGEELSLAAEAVIEGQRVLTRLLPSLPTDASKVPQTLVRQAQTTRAPVVMGEAELAEGPLSSDPYFAHHRPRSALCLPIVRQAALVGVLYLENDLAGGAFTTDRMAALILIASQAAIAIDNARHHREAEALATRNAGLVQSLREADRCKDEFLALLGHELRNPLTPIRNSVFLLKRAPEIGPKAARAVAVIDRQAAQLSRLVDDLLDVTRVVRGKARLQRSRVDLAELMERTAEDHRAAFAEHQIGFEMVVGARPLWVDGDPARLVQVAGNLLNNALKFTPLGGRVDVLVTRDDSGRAVLEVADSGEGIDAPTLARLFQPFAQAERSLDRSQGGLGLGLTLVKGIVELHGGEVRARSEGPGRGASFTVILPLVERAKTAGLPAPQYPGHAPRRRVLVIEDNHDVANSLREVLEDEGHRVAVSYSGADGVTAAREFRPEVIICDIGLPAGMDGFAVARALRDDPRTASARLIALTGYAQPEDRRLSLQAGFDAHLSKPPDLEALARLLAEAPALDEQTLPAAGT